MHRTIFGLLLFCLPSPMMWAGQLTIVTATGLNTPELTLEGLRQKYQSPYVVSENRVGNSGQFSVYMPGFAPNGTLDTSKGYMVHTTLTPSIAGLATTPTVTIHPGFNLIAPPSGITSAQQAISELGLAMLAKSNSGGKFEAVLEGTNDNFSLEPSRGYLGIPKARSKGTGIIFSEEDEFHVWHLKTMSETSGQWSNVTTFGPFSSGDFDPAYTADGTKVLFASSRGCPITIGLFQVNADGSNIQRLTGTTPAGDCLSVLNQTPAPRSHKFKILLKAISSFPGSSSDIALYPSTRGASFTDPVFITSDLNEQNPVFSSDGQTIYFLADWEGILKIYSVPTSIGTTTEFSDARRLTMATKLSDRPVTADGLSVAPDGSVVFTSTGDIWRRSWDGIETNLTNTPGVDEKEASYSPDGSRIAYIRANSNGVYTQVCTMRADGSGQTLIHDSGREVSINHAWKP